MRDENRDVWMVFESRGGCTGLSSLLLFVASPGVYGSPSSPRSPFDPILILPVCCTEASDIVQTENDVLEVRITLSFIPFQHMDCVNEVLSAIVLN
jgi:hypothetical protein